jgi:hypothetical protein
MPDLITLSTRSNFLIRLTPRGIPPDYYEENADPWDIRPSDLVWAFLAFFADCQQLCLTMMPPCDVPHTWSAVTLAWL